MLFDLLGFVTKPYFLHFAEDLPESCRFDFATPAGPLPGFLLLPPRRIQPGELDYFCFSGTL